MSFILDALKKSEARRRLGQTPGLESGMSPEAPARRGFPLLLILTGVVVVLSALLLWREFGDRLSIGEPVAQGEMSESGDPSGGDAVPLPEPDHTRAVAEDESRPGRVRAAHTERPVREPARRSDEASPPTDPETREPARPVRERSSPPVRADSPEAAARLEEIAAREQDGARPDVGETTPAGDEDVATPGVTRLVPETPVEPPPAEPETGDGSAATDSARPEPAEPASDTAGASSAPALPEPPEAEFEPNKPEWLEHWELPPSVRKNLPDLDLSVLVFAETPGERFVLINAERYGEGDVVAEGVNLVRIARDGAVLEYDDYRFLLRQ